MTFINLRPNDKKNPIMGGSGKRVFQVEGTETTKARKELGVFKITKEDQCVWRRVRKEEMEKPDHPGPSRGGQWILFHFRVTGAPGDSKVWAMTCSVSREYVQQRASFTQREFLSLPSAPGKFPQSPWYVLRWVFLFIWGFQAMPDVYANNGIWAREHWLQEVLAPLLEE